MGIASSVPVPKAAVRAASRRFNAALPQAPVDRSAMLARIFKACDDDDSGFLSLMEFRQVAKEDEANAEWLQRFFSTMDSRGNSDGKVSVDEFTAFHLDLWYEMSDKQFKDQAHVWLRLAQQRRVVDRDALLRTLFEACDDDHSGVLSVHELAQIAKEQNSVTNVLVEGMLVYMDTHGDRNGKVTIDEFVRYNIEAGKDLTDREFKKQVKTWHERAIERVVLPSPRQPWQQPLVVETPAMLAQT